jgi:hypothetical protein
MEWKNVLIEEGYYWFRHPRHRASQVCSVYTAVGESKTGEKKDLGFIIAVIGSADPYFPDEVDWEFCGPILKPELT